MLYIHRGEIFYLVLGDAELNAVGRPVRGAGRDDRADRDGDVLVAPQVALGQQDMGHVVTGRVDDQAVNVPDGAIRGVHAVPAADGQFAGRDRVEGDGLRD